ncbi:MAG: glycosyltransferase family 1 protein, partial [Planctomycetota bacterium]
SIELAVGSDRYDDNTFRDGGWRYVRGLPVSVMPDGYRDYITCSAGEWSVAKNVYAAMRTGWFSCRTACYLAAGRPAVVQDTGWTKTLPSDAGCLAFDTEDEAAAKLDAILADYGRHREAAYDFAREHLAADRVLPPMLEAIGNLAS